MNLQQAEIISEYLPHHQHVRADVCFCRPILFVVGQTHEPCMSRLVSATVILLHLR
jgi:hypothetical protein